MITYTGISKTETKNQYNFTGLSTDEKPTLAKYPDMQNGSSFFEMDTMSVKFWDAEHSVWI